jgi:Flp pilus assembly protein TadD
VAALDGNFEAAGRHYRRAVERAPDDGDVLTVALPARGVAFVTIP